MLFYSIWLLGLRFWLVANATCFSAGSPMQNLSSVWFYLSNILKTYHLTICK